MSSKIADQNELGVFLRARRAELSRSDVHLPEGGTQRRVAGLRRDEVAQLASISTDYYTRLEQDRIHPSAPVLASLARVLRLDDDQRTYLYELAGTNPASARARRRAPQKIKPHMQRVLDHITDTPAIVMTPTHDILAWNQLAAAWSPDGKPLAFAAKGLHVVAANGGAARRLLRRGVEAPEWSPDGRHIRSSGATTRRRARRSSSSIRRPPPEAAR